MANSKNFDNLKCKKFHYTYQTKCLINNKTYLGRHSTNDLNDGYIGSGKLLKRAIAKYGKDNFKCIILDFFNTYKELVEEESFLVTKEWCLLKSNYNLVEGAENPRMYGKDNPSWKGGISKEPNYRKTGKKHCFKKENNPRWGYKYSEEEKIKMIHSQPNNIVFIGDNIEYNSIKECSRILGRSRDWIIRRLNSSDFPKWYKK